MDLSIGRPCPLDLVIFVAAEFLQSDDSRGQLRYPVRRDRFAGCIAALRQGVVRI